LVGLVLCRFVRWRTDILRELDERQFQPVADRNSRWLELLGWQNGASAEDLLLRAHASTVKEPQ